jgi:hypothetical protein
MDWVKERPRLNNCQNNLSAADVAILAVVTIAIVAHSIPIVRGCQSSLRQLAPTSSCRPGGRFARGGPVQRTQRSATQSTRDHGKQYRKK